MATEIEPRSRIELVGYPNGPKLFVPQLGCEVGTFKDKPPTLRRQCLMWHVPLDKRGEFRPAELANYDPEKTYRTSDLGYVMCYGQTKSGMPCKNNAVNRYPRCEMHGGMLHPNDKIKKATQKLSLAIKSEPEHGKSRYKQFQDGEITVDDLDDEELACCGFRDYRGNIFRPKQIPRSLADAFQRAIFERAQRELRTHAVDAARTMAEIMNNKKVDNEVRLKAAQAILERNLGKAPQILAITTQSPWEEIFDGITSGSREISRKARRDETIDAETVELDESDSSVPDDKGDKGYEESSGEDRNDENAGSEHDAGDSEHSNPSKSEIAGDIPTNARLFERNPAILAQEIELPDYEFHIETGS